MLTLPAMILIGLGLLLTLIGGVWGIVVAFRRSLIWGLCYLFVPFAALVFLVVAWADAKRAFFVNTIGVLLLASVLLLPNQGGLGLTKQMAFDLQSLTAPSPALPDAVVLAPKNVPLAELAAREQSLRARKAALKPEDLAAARVLTDEILKYNADLKTASGAPTATPSGGAVAVSDNPAPK